MRYTATARGDRALATLLAGTSGFQVAVASGAPLGAWSWGGAHEGVLPPELRAASGIAAVVWGAAAVAVATGRPGGEAAHRGVRLGLALVSSLGAVANLASPSLPERLVWVPVTTAVAALAWRAARADHAEPLTA
jgi:hypothetical protein